MKRYLLDTHVFIWWITADPKLSKKATSLIASTENEILISAVTAWEIAIKASLGRLNETGNPESTVPMHIQKNNFQVLDISVKAALGVFSLPTIHSDPFDRLLVSQAKVEKVPIISIDDLFDRYGIERVF